MHQTATSAPGIAPLTTDFSRRVYCLLGVPLDAIDRKGTVARLAAAVAARAPTCFSTPNMNMLVAAQRDHAFRAALTRAELSVADGMSLVWLSLMLGIPIRERVAGSDVFESLTRGEGGPMGVYFFGGPDGAAEAACKQLNALGGPVRGVGFDSPGFGDVEQLSQPDMIARINQSGADFVVLAMGAAKGQAWITHNRAALAPPLLSHLGAVVNFVAGSLARAPVVARLSGMEWLWRIKGEPALWRRYRDDGRAMLPLFFGHVLPQALGRLFGAGRGGGPAPRATASNAGAATLVAISGDWAAADLAPLRVLFADHTRAAGDMEVDFTGLAGADAAFLGLFMLLFGHQSKVGRALVVRGVDARVRKLFDRACAAYLLEGVARR
jgi:N-acetylglucosaminyldiphosphoundecaprenol N-acetyl-beta-D-mannosaminyltransferase